VATEGVLQPPLRRPEAAPSSGDDLPALLEAWALRLLACAASVALLVCLLILPSGPSESDETRSWLLAFALALPGGMALAAYQARLLSSAAPAATARALAAGAGLLTLAFALRRGGSGAHLHHALIALAAAAALAAPLLAARLWRDPADRATAPYRVFALACLAVLALLFVPAPALRPVPLLAALAIAALALPLLRLRLPLPAWARRALDGAVCILIALVAIQLPDIAPYAPDLIHHHGFFLGPANDVLHGRAAIGDSWSQYGVGLIDSLGLAFTVIPIGYGTLSLILVALVTAQYLCVYGTLRLAGLGQILAVATIAVAVLGNLFSPLEFYSVFPSDTALRFGLPYLIVLAAVLAARYPARGQAARVAILGVLAVGAVWSFESFVYCAATYGALALIEAICAREEVWRRLLRAALVGLAVSAIAIATFSLLTLLFDGHLSWGPYIEYLRLYSVQEFSTLPIVFFSAGPLMAAAIFLSAMSLLWLAIYRPLSLAPPVRAALAGFTGFAIATFTYYLGRSHPNNLLVLLVPTVALGGLWVHVLLKAPTARWRFALAGPLLVAASMIAIASLPSVKTKWPATALSLTLPGQDGSLRFSLERLAENPVLDSRAPAAAALLEALPSTEPVAVLTEPELTTEVLMRAGRNNLLPISHPPEDDLIDSSDGRVLAAIRGLPAGTLLLTSPPAPPGTISPTGEPSEFNLLQEHALEALHRRFGFRLVRRTPEGIELVRLTPKSGG
jgi:hypothetical protein